MLKVSEVYARLEDPHRRWFRHKATGHLVDSIAETHDRYTQPIVVSLNRTKDGGEVTETRPCPWEEVPGEWVRKCLDDNRRLPNEHVSFIPAMPPPAPAKTRNTRPEPQASQEAPEPVPEKSSEPATAPAPEPPADSPSVPATPRFGKR